MSIINAFSAELELAVINHGQTYNCAHNDRFCYTLPMSKTDKILLQINERGIATLIVNRPEARNALNWTAQAHFAAAITEVAVTPGVRILIITGAGERSFVSGGDLKELCCAPTREEGERLNEGMGAALAELAALPFPVIAAINGDAFGGGCELVTACDLRVARPEARLSFAQVRNGLTTGWGGTRRLVRQVGQGRAMDLLLSGRVFTAAEGQQFGLIQRLAVDGQTALQAALEWADELGRLPATAAAALKQLVLDAPYLDMAAAQALEAQMFTSLWGKPDHLEALKAFAERRPPIFNQQTDAG